MKQTLTSLVALLAAVLILAMGLWFEGTHAFSTTEGFEHIRYPRAFELGNVDWVMMGRLAIALFVLFFPWVNGSEQTDRKRKMLQLFPDIQHRGLNMLLSLLNFGSVVALGIAYGHMAFSNEFYYTPRDQQVLGGCLTLCIVFWALAGFTAGFRIWLKRKKQ